MSDDDPADTELETATETLEIAKATLVVENERFAIAKKALTLAKWEAVLTALLGIALGELAYVVAHHLTIAVSCR